MTTRVLAWLFALSVAATAGAQNTPPVLTDASGFGGGVSLNGVFYFTKGNELWKSDGTAAGTSLVEALNNPPDKLTTCNGLVFFVVGLWEIWRSDGSAAGTSSMGAATPNQSPVCAGRTLYFTRLDSSNATQLWKTDGTTQNTLQITSSLLNITSLTSVHDELYFKAVSNRFGLWKSDGTFAGTSRVWTGGVGLLTQVGSQLLFADLYYQPAGGAVWRTDGSAAGTVRLVAGGNPQAIADAGGTAFVFRTGLWKSDGTPAGTTMLRSPMTSTDAALVASSGRLFFRGADATVTGESLWKSDGTSAGTSDAMLASDARLLTDCDGLLCFGTSQGTWLTDGVTSPVAVSSALPYSITKAGRYAFIVTTRTWTSPSPWQLIAVDLPFAAASIAPSVASMAGGTSVTISGTGFTNATALAVDGVPVAPATVSPTGITFNAPAHAQGTVDVVLTSNNGQQARMRDALSFACDSLPVAAAAGDATVCPLTPTPLSGSGGVACSWLPATGLSDSTSCTPMAAPYTTTTYRLTVKNAAGCVSTNAADVTVQVTPAPYASISASVPVGGQSVFYVGDAGPGATYRWTVDHPIVGAADGRTISVVLDCRIIAASVTVTNATGCSATSSTALSLLNAALQVVAPASGLVGSKVTLTGRGFLCATAVRFGGASATMDLHIDSDTQLRTTVPKSALSGVVEVLVGGVWVHAIRSFSGSFSVLTSAQTGDMDIDGRPDILFRNPVTGVDAVWTMNGTQFGSLINIASFANADYHIVGMGDFNRDGWNDLLLHNRVTGANAIWRMSGLAYAGVTNLPGIPDTNFELEGTGDFNGDGMPDILIRNQATGANAIWLMDGMTVQSIVNLPGLPNTGYRMAGSGDFNGDGKADIVWRNASTGANAVWLMDGTAFSAILDLPSLANSGYTIGAIADYDGDGKPDIVWRNASTGANAIWLMNGATTTATVNLPGVMIPQMEIAGPR